jgi:sarcosine oxidase subunit alpha
VYAFRIARHPILAVEPVHEIPFTWQGQQFAARAGETIAAALLANGVRVFGHHLKDGAPQGIFCANGQCAQCLVIADGRPVKSCMEPVRAGMAVEPLEALPVLPQVGRSPDMGETHELAVPVLILGGGPAGLSAAIELGKRGVETLLVDDKHRLGGKLVLQTHRFFGSASAVYAGTRGIEIARKLEDQVRALEGVEVWLNTTALAVYGDQKVGMLTADGCGGGRHVLVRPEVLLIATGAREKSLAFTGNTLPGVFGAGAFQTLVNRDLVRVSERLFIVGGGNVGLIAAYHALQAGIEVVGLVEAMPACGGYKVHKDKLLRLGVPVYTSHTVVSANGHETVESVTIARVDDRFHPIPGTERSFACDTVLIAVGLAPVDEFYHKARAFEMRAFAAGDAAEIAEASAAIFSGRIVGLEVARALGYEVEETPQAWHRAAELLKSRPGKTVEEHLPETESGFVPVLHCIQEIPCDPCAAVCPQGLIHIAADDLRQVPTYLGAGSEEQCLGCERCVAACPGLAITLVDYRDPQYPTVTVPYEFLEDTVSVGQAVTAVDTTGRALGTCEVVRVRKTNGATTLVRISAPRAYARRIAGIRVPEADTAPTEHTVPKAQYVERLADDAIVCRCERVTAQEIRALIRQGVRDINELKALTRVGMGACGGKTCTPLVHRLFQEEGVPAEEVVEGVRRPLFVEVPLGIFAQISDLGVLKD